MDVVAKAEALAQRALQRSAVEKQVAADQRAETWAKIQNTEPMLAKFMTDLIACLASLLQSRLSWTARQLLTKARLQSREGFLTAS